MKKILLVGTLFLAVPQNSSAAFNWQQYNTPENQKYALISAAVLGWAGCIYNLAGKWSTKSRLSRAEGKIEEVGSRLQHMQSKYADQGKIEGIYQVVSEVASRYEKYNAIMAQRPSPEEQIKRISRQLEQDHKEYARYVHNRLGKAIKRGNKLRRGGNIDRPNQVLPHPHEAFPQDIKTLEKKKVELSHARIARTPLLIAQATTTIKKITQTLETIREIQQQVAYTKALSYQRKQTDFFSEELNLSRYFDRPEALMQQLDATVRLFSNGKEEYPYRAYLDFLDGDIKQLSSLCNSLHNAKLLLFQQETRSYIFSTHELLTTIKKHILVSREYGLENQKFKNDKRIANEREESRRRHDEQIKLKQKELSQRQEENEQLRYQMRNMESQISNLNNQVYWQNLQRQQQPQP